MNPAVDPRRIGRYEILKPIGKGAMGVVYLAHDPVLERDIALKVMVPQIVDDPELNRRFEREAKAVARMSHPNVVTVHDLGSHADGSPYIAMELLKGQDLSKAMRETPPLALPRKLSIIAQVLAGLAHAHQAGIVHRDIKPANVFLTRDGGVKIMDFGVARFGSATSTATGQVVGTAAYMSPEQVQGAHVDGRSDLFSVGSMLYELVAGRRPFHSDDMLTVLFKITYEEPDLARLPDDGEHAGLRAIVQKALAKRLDDRYQTAQEFAGALREVLARRVTSVSGVSVLEGLLEGASTSSPPQPTEVPPATEPATGTMPSPMRPPASPPLRTAPTLFLQLAKRPASRAWAAIVATAMAVVLYLVGFRGTPSKQNVGAPTSPSPSSDAGRGESPAPAPIVVSPEPTRTPTLAAGRSLSPLPRPIAVSATPGASPPLPAGSMPPSSASAAESALLALLSQAETAFAAEQYDAAIELYDQALQIDRANQRAGTGKSNALGAKAMARSAAGSAKRTGAGGFVAGPTTALAPEGEEDGAEGFEKTPGVAVRPGDQLAALPGKILFEVSPETVRPGVPFTIKVQLQNGGSAPIRIRSVQTRFMVNGGVAGGPVTSLTREAAPRERALLLNLSDYWRDDTSSWSLEVTIKTERGETYRGHLTWK